MRACVCMRVLVPRAKCWQILVLREDISGKRGRFGRREKLWKTNQCRKYFLFFNRILSYLVICLNIIQKNGDGILLILFRLIQLTITRWENVFSENKKGAHFNLQETEHKEAVVDAFWFICQILCESLRTVFALSPTRGSPGRPSVFCTILVPHLGLLIVSNGIAYLFFCLLPFLLHSRGLSLCSMFTQTPLEVHLCLYLIWCINYILHPFRHHEQEPAASWYR